MSISSRAAKTRMYLVRDITGIAWISKHYLIYSVSPIYGQPGIFLLDCRSLETKTIVGPRNISKAYPNGSDYFELQSFSRDLSGTIYFYYAPDVDQVDFVQFRTNAFLYQVNLDGTEFSKTRQKEERPEKKERKIP
ncbi:MAG: hypothetical protein JRJ26_11050 [Deltaproteobacteria bacterium]|nr:hypothetical protein [Deltaproteobacteria bacterium]